MCIHHTINNVNNSESKSFCPTYFAQNKAFLVIVLLLWLLYVLPKVDINSMYSCYPDQILLKYNTRIFFKPDLQRLNFIECSDFWRRNLILESLIYFYKVLYDQKRNFCNHFRILRLLQSANYYRSVTWQSRLIKLRWGIWETKKLIKT